MAPREDRSQGRKHGMALLVHRRKITADATKRGRSAIAAKRSGDLLLNFHHPKIPLSEIVRTWQSKVVE